MIKEQSITFDNFLTEKDYSIKEDTEILYLYFYVFYFVIIIILVHNFK